MILLKTIIMKKNMLLYMIIICVFSCNIFSQNSEVTAPDITNDNYSYVDPLKTYERVIEKGYKSIELLKKLGNATYFNEELDKSAKWYGQLFALTNDLESEYYFRYARSLKSIDEIDKANEMMTKFNQKTEVNTNTK
jgi:hypothetical protein